MPRRKKNGQSPARVPGGPPEGGSFSYNTDNRVLQGFDGSMANNFTPSTSLSSSDKENIVRSMQDVFSHLDPEVIYIVLAECDFKVENAMDSLLELSVAAEVAAPIPSPVSGFELTAAALLSSQHPLEPRPDPDLSGPSQPLSSPTLLTEELDLLVDQELETLTTKPNNSAEHHSSQYISSFPPLPPQQDLPELLQSSLQPGSRGPPVQQQGPVGGHVESISGASSPLDQLSTWEDEVTKEQKPVGDLTHLLAETSVDAPKPPLDLAASGRPSAFQVYKKQDSAEASSDMGKVMPSNAVVGGARSKVNPSNPAQLSYMPSPWNLEAPEFSPHFHGNQGPAFITPVAQTPSSWQSLPRHPSPWLGQGPISQAPLKPFATIPKSWSQPAAPHPPVQHSRLRLEGKVLVLLRGAPGSGKSTLARDLVNHNPGGVRLSTDDFFTRHGRYHFDPTALGEAHEWNHRRAKEAFEARANPIIIDNTNMQGWEMKPYVSLALKHGYKVLFREPDTWWKNKPRELQRRTTHEVPVETIRRMLTGYERFVTVQSIMGSQMPEFKQQILQEKRNLQLDSAQPRPDLVGQPKLTEGCKKLDSELFSSLPDVSSVGCSDLGSLGGAIIKPQESLNLQTTQTLTENSEMLDGDDEMDLGDLDSELDAQLELNIAVDQGIPDCIVESVMSQDQHEEEEVPVAFSDSIGQRVRRERTSRRSGFDKLEPADLVKDTNQSEKEKMEGKGTEGAEADKGTQNMLDFVGDWPCEGSLQQRQARRRERVKNVNSKEEGLSQEENKTKGKSGSKVAEFQKLLDLIQTGGAAVYTSSSHSSSVSLSSGEESTKEEVEESDSSRSDSEEKEQHNNRVISELPDCVLDWKGAESYKGSESRFDIQQPHKTVTDGCSLTGGNHDDKTEIEDYQNPLSAPAADSLVFSQTVEANICKDEEGSKKTQGEVATEPECGAQADKNGSEARAESDGGHVSEVSLSPVCEGAVDADGSSVYGGSQERKQRQGRRSGKHCKLALTFTQNCSASHNTPEGSDTTATSINTSQTSVNTDVESDSMNIHTHVSIESEPEVHPQPPSSPLLGETGTSSQTEAQDFALLWRLNHRDGPDDASASLPSDITVLSGDSSHFVPGVSSAAVPVHPSGLTDVPYRVVHEKGTQVEEKEFEPNQDRLESLRILSRHFKLVSFDTLEDLYDKCHQDLEWTTNLLLDSGERFFKDDDGVREMEEFEENQKISILCGAVGEAGLCTNMLDEQHPEGLGTQLITDGSVGAASDHHHATSSLEEPPKTKQSLPSAENEGDSEQNKVTSDMNLEGRAWGVSCDDGVIIEESRVEIDEEMANMDEIQRLLQAELEEMERQEKKERSERSSREGRRKQHLDIKSVELKLPTELALQLTELFGPVGVDPGLCSSDDYDVQMDLNLAKLIHQKWKETIQEKQRQAALSFHLLQESSAHWGESQGAKQGRGDPSQAARFLISTDGSITQDGYPENRGQIPFMDHWSASRPLVSLREIIKEEQALQENVEKTRLSRADLDRRDGATMLKENQLFSLFPTIDRHFLQDIFRDHNYSLTETELFLRSLLAEEPVKTVVAPEVPRSDHHRAASKDREKRQKPPESTVPDYQDTEDPEYEDFRAEASLQRRRQLENFAKAAEAYKQGRKEVASFYAQQGHMHGKRMREANHRAAVQIFQRVNKSLLPRNILDLHGLHVDEALKHLAQVLQDKSTECEQGLCQPQLSIITGRGNHSQGGVARIRPAVLDYLTSKHYRFTEPNTGHVLVSLK
ncbi:NEDD4-binding protein 2 [Halichoeres trimaculatus]|uniref:NEDD4-binding protein 2 n=1 Tax=Halichoeres trimaculatus TaxID=147232 RepID=UPI003D9E7A98